MRKNHKKYGLFIFVLFNVCYYFGDTATSYQTDEENIVATVLTGYLKNVRPTQEVLIEVYLSFIQINSIEEKTQTITTNSYFTMTWYDTRLSWNPNSYNGLTDVIIPVKSIWTPDMAVINQADSDGFFKYNEYNLATVEYNGQVFITISLNSLKTRCKMNVRNFPFDSQSCNIIIGSWTQTSDRLNLELGDKTVKTDDYVENPVWGLKGTSITIRNSTKRIPSFLSSLNLTCDEVNFTINIKRGPLYFMMNAIFPCLLLMCLTLLFFFLPYGSQVGLSMSSILTFSVYSLRVSSDIPVQSEYLPTISYYFIFVISFILIDFFWFIILNFFNDRKKIPRPMELYAINLRKIVSKVRGIFSCDKKQENIVNPGDKNLKIEAVSEKEEKAEIKTIEEPKLKCNKCDLCIDCQKEKDKDEKKKKDKEELEANIRALNLTAFTIVLILTIIYNMAIWITISA